MAHRAEGLNDIFEHSVIVREDIDVKGGTIQQTPTDDTDIPNKKYIDDAIDSRLDTFGDQEIPYSDATGKLTSEAAFLYDTTFNRMTVGSINTGGIQSSSALGINSASAMSISAQGNGVGIGDDVTISGDIFGGGSTGKLTTADYATIGGTTSQIGITGDVDLIKLEANKITIKTTTEVAAKIKMTSIGGYAIKLTNKTGANSVAGQLVKADTATNDAVILAAAGDVECFGVFLDAGDADSAEAWVVVSGIADVAHDDNVAAVRGDWISTGVLAGYAATATSPAVAPTHFEEIGHCIETVAAGGAGTHILARCVLHFN